MKRRQAFELTAFFMYGYILFISHHVKLLFDVGPLQG